MTVKTTELAAANGAGFTARPADALAAVSHVTTWPFGAPVVAAIVFAVPLRVRRRRCARASNHVNDPGHGCKRFCSLRVVLLTGVVLSLFGCGGGFALPGTSTTQPTPDTYTITIAGTSGSLQHSTSVQITLQ
jgi:hypothetical protein